MTAALDVEAIDLSELTRELVRRCGAHVAGSLAGPTLLRDELVRYLGCSDLEAENLIDTLIARGFVVRADAPDGLVEWTIGGLGS